VFFNIVRHLHCPLRPDPADRRDPARQPGFPEKLCQVSRQTAEGRHFGGPSLISEKTAATSADLLRNIITNGKGRMPKYAGKTNIGRN